MSYYVHVFNRGQKRRMDIDPEKGLGKFIHSHNILEKRVSIESGEELQDLLAQGFTFSILKFDPHRFRWKSMVLFNRDNAYVDDNDLVINDNPKPLKLAGLVDTDPFNLDILTVHTSDRPNLTPRRHLSVIKRPRPRPQQNHTPTENSPYYVHVFQRGQKKRLYINLSRGLGNYLVTNQILERRITVETPQALQELLAQEQRFAILKFDPTRFRWKSLILFDQHNAHLDGDLLVINDTAKPLSHSGITGEDPHNLDVLTVEHIEQKPSSSQAQEPFQRAAS